MGALGNLKMVLKKVNATGRKRNTGVMISKCDRGACVAFGVAPQYDNKKGCKRTSILYHGTFVYWMSLLDALRRDCPATSLTEVRPGGEPKNRGDKHKVIM